MDILSNKIKVEWNSELNALCISTDGKDSRENMVKIKLETLDKMSFKEACEFVGGDLLLLMPAIRRLYAEELNLTEDQIVGKF